ncbi:SRPBCC domain-containing protein [Sphingopyxis panaciterrulae]|uniref:Uncharacterized protein YndB with AHSA1/START domain n=1 Tax=Sphingopyxis panaciterrulae TaxID=462372 RepID=A0A7W9B6X0_9SPHN|nr:SRPBCC domain-containing protein [Sphingopyxis panaciterrulae]MBB5707390.1 uncharacterized protein YndB with AHSA1/START domain [Sphingopyxis panaciterrulae]
MNLAATHTTSRTILATPRAIFRTLLDPETIPSWRPPRGMAGRIEQFDPRPGGAYRMIFQYPHDDAARDKCASGAVIIDGQFIEILPDERLVEVVRFDTDDCRFQGAITVTTMLEPVKDGTKVTLSAQDVPPGLGEADHRAGMDAMLKNLANFVE